MSNINNLGVTTRNDVSVQTASLAVFPSVFYGDGSADVEDWLLEFEAVSDANQWSVITKRLMLPAFLRGVALRWYSSINEVTNDEKKLDFVLLKLALLTRFQSVDLKEKRRLEFESISQRKSESVADFCLRFNSLSALQELSDTVICTKFKESLLPEIRKWVYFAAPKSLSETMETARRAESCNQAEQQESGNSSKVLSSTKDTDIDKLTDQIAKLVIKKINSNHVAKENPQVRPLLCTICNKEGHLASYCFYREQPKKSMERPLGETGVPKNHPRN